jgi:hypothetical protein
MRKTDVEQEIKIMTEIMTENKMSNYKTTIMQVSIHHESVNPVFGHGNTYVSVDDEAAGPFLVIEQHDDDGGEHGKLRFEYEEFAAVAEAAKMLMHQMYIEQATPDGVGDAR